MENKSLQELALELQAQKFEASGNIYHPLPFPEFEHLKTSSNPKSAHDKWKLISQSLPSSLDYSRLNVLDVGANAGFYSFKFAQLGASVDAYEPHEHYVNIGRRVVDVTGLSVQWHHKPLELSDIDKQYDVSVMLSVFQWMAQGNERLEEASVILQKIASSSRYLFFELGCNQGKSAITTKQRSLVWVWELLQQRAAPKRVVYLGSASAWGRARRYLFVCSEEPVVLTPWQRFVTAVLQNGWVR